MKPWILDKWDWWIYKRAFNSLRRLCESNQGFAYLFELHLRDYRAEHPISKQLKLASRRRSKNGHRQLRRRVPRRG